MAAPGSLLVVHFATAHIQLCSANIRNFLFGSGRLDHSYLIVKIHFGLVISCRLRWNDVCLRVATRIVSPLTSLSLYTSYTFCCLCLSVCCSVSLRPCMSMSVNISLFRLSVCLSVCLCVSLSGFCHPFVPLPICLSVCMSACLSVCLPVALSIALRLYVCLSLCLSHCVCLSACRSVYRTACLSEVPCSSVSH